LARQFRNGRRTKIFARMVLAGETAVPPERISYACAKGCLDSLRKDKWYCIKNGSERLVSELYNRSNASRTLNASVTSVEEMKKTVKVRWHEIDKSRSEDFDAAIITTPDGERLL